MGTYIEINRKIHFNLRRPPNILADPSNVNPPQYKGHTVKTWVFHECKQTFFQSVFNVLLYKIFHSKINTEEYC